VKYRMWRGLGLCWECMVVGRGFTLPDSMRDMVDGGIPRERGRVEVRGKGGKDSGREGKRN